MGAKPKPTISNVVASTSSGGSSGLKHLLPTFSSDDDEYNTAKDDDGETDNEASFKPARKWLKTIPAGRKNLNPIKGNRPKGPSGFQKIAAANRSAHTGAPNETRRG